jgi:hypothetical protein
MITFAQVTLDSGELKGTIAIAMGVLGLAYLMYRSSAKKRRHDPLDRPSGPSLAQQRSVERQMQGLLVEMAEMARQISAQLDTRAAKLEELIRQADERIERMAAEKASSPVQAGPSERVEPPPPDAVAPEHQKIYKLADAGMSTPDIAREMAWPRGEVELVLSLRRSA